MLLVHLGCADVNWLTSGSLQRPVLGSFVMSECTLQYELQCRLCSCSLPVSRIRAQREHIRAIDWGCMLWQHRWSILSLGLFVACWNTQHISTVASTVSKNWGQNKQVAVGYRNSLGNNLKFSCLGISIFLGTWIKGHFYKQGLVLIYASIYRSA